VSSYYYVCVLVLLYVCPYATRPSAYRTSWSKSYGSRSLYMCPPPRAAIYVSSYYYMCVLILLDCPHIGRAGARATAAGRYICVLVQLYVSLYYYTVCILLYMRLRTSWSKSYSSASLYMCPPPPRTVIYVSVYYYMCVLILLYCPHIGRAGARATAAGRYICVLILLYMCPRTTICVSLYY
jgi:hypothetical protein